jgi:hypothetical protein
MMADLNIKLIIYISFEKDTWTRTSTNFDLIHNDSKVANIY